MSVVFLELWVVLIFQGSFLGVPLLFTRFFWTLYFDWRTLLFLLDLPVNVFAIESHLFTVTFNFTVLFISLSTEIRFCGTDIIVFNAIFAACLFLWTLNGINYLDTKEWPVMQSLVGESGDKFSRHNYDNYCGSRIFDIRLLYQHEFPWLARVVDDAVVDSS